MEDISTLTRSPLEKITSSQKTKRFGSFLKLKLKVNGRLSPPHPFKCHVLRTIKHVNGLKSLVLSNLKCLDILFNKLGCGGWGDYKHFEVKSHIFSALFIKTILNKKWKYDIIRFFVKKFYSLCNIFNF